MEQSTKTQLCPECGKRIMATARRCRFCRAAVQAPAQETTEKSDPFKPCPKCNAGHAQRVKWTPWGSVYGPRLLHQVRCPRCGYSYNGKTGISNFWPAVVFVSLPLAGIAGCLWYVISILIERNWLQPF